RSMALVASLRATARSRSAYLVSSHRGPYDGLIALLVRHERWRDALAVVLELDASDMLRATAVERIERNQASDDGEAEAPGPAAEGRRRAGSVAVSRSGDRDGAVGPADRIGGRASLSVADPEWRGDWRGCRRCAGGARVGQGAVRRPGGAAGGAGAGPDVRAA